MKVAFDVSGTLFGPAQNKVVKLFSWFQEQGCEMYIWSTSYSYTEEAQSTYQLKATCIEKFNKAEAKKRALSYMDICVDDDLAQRMMLASLKTISLEEIPEDPALFADAFGNLLKTV